MIHHQAPAYLTQSSVIFTPGILSRVCQLIYLSNIHAPHYCLVHAPLRALILLTMPTINSSIPCWFTDVFTCLLSRSLPILPVLIHSLILITPSGHYSVKGHPFLRPHFGSTLDLPPHSGSISDSGSWFQVWLQHSGFVSCLLLSGGSEDVSVAPLSFWQNSQKQMESHSSSTWQHATSANHFRLGHFLGDWPHISGACTMTLGP